MLCRLQGVLAACDRKALGTLLAKIPNGVALLEMDELLAGCHVVRREARLFSLE